MIVNLLMMFAFSRDYYENFMLRLCHVIRILSVKKCFVKEQERSIRIQLIGRIRWQKYFLIFSLPGNTDLSGTFAVFQQVFEGDACSFRVS